MVGANFENANLYKADLRGVVGLTVEQLSKAKTLYQAKLDDQILQEINQNFAQLLLRQA